MPCSFPSRACDILLSHISLVHEGITMKLSLPDHYLNFARLKFGKLTQRAVVLGCEGNRCWHRPCYPYIRCSNPGDAANPKHSGQRAVAEGCCVRACSVGGHQSRHAENEETEEASTSKAIEVREEPSETPSQLSIALDEPCVSLTPSLFEGLETHGKNMGLLRHVCGVGRRNKFKSLGSNVQQKSIVEQGGSQCSVVMIYQQPQKKTTGVLHSK
ncbi:hypothetical protein Zmor_027913 [Zophobas morio]|uniref:Uncharacterized protein n=1 Tax=Zophobas morio TaxID=2755281 RepID=A0AA38HP39_9CUCU|nr:hypothetical protein Zmor_027913 [Zophobas morio]